MADARPFEDEATLYVLGRMGEGERRAFEARLEQSSELRALVRELEGGTLALTLAQPQHEPPPQVWERIKTTIAEESDRKIVAVSVWPGLLRSGWAAAAACLVGWLLYEVWVSRSSERVKPATSLAETRPLESTGVESPKGEAVTVPNPTATNLPNARPPVNTLVLIGETAALRRQVADLESQVALLSQALTQQQALLPGTNQFRLLQLTAPGDSNPPREAPLPSPALQRALLLALAREMGWVSPAGIESRGVPHSLIPGVDFVALSPPGKEQENGKLIRSGINTPVPTPEKQSDVGTPPDTTPSDSTTPATSPKPSIPVLIAGGNLYLAVDSSVVPPNTAQLTIWNSASGYPQAIGSFGVGSNPLLVGLPMWAVSGGVWSLTAGSGLPTAVNTIGQFSDPNYPH